MRERTCSAYVCKLGRFYILKSYRTIVAAIDTRDDICYDFLRKVYGYTFRNSRKITVQVNGTVQNDSHGGRYRPYKRQGR